VDAGKARSTYPLDTPEVAEFKLLLNFHLTESVRARILDALFADFLGDEAAFARELYLNWDEARAMQDAGMLFGGHTHRHVALATLSDEEQHDDLSTSTKILRQRLKPQALWPFTYPYGQDHSFNAATVRNLRELGYNCALTTNPGPNEPGHDLFRLLRLDTVDVPRKLLCAA
jgi:hypothetical protein